MYNEVEEKQDLAVAQQQPPPTGQIYYAAQSQVGPGPGTVYQMPYQIPQMHQQVNGVTE